MPNDEWSSYHHVKESGSANHPKKKGVDKVGTVSKEGTLINFTVNKATKFMKDDAKTIQDENDVQMKVPKAVTEKKLKEFLFNIEKNTLFLNQWETHQ